MLVILQKLQMILFNIMTFMNNYRDMLYYANGGKLIATINKEIYIMIFICMIYIFLYNIDLLKLTTYNFGSGTRSYKRKNISGLNLLATNKDFYKIANYGLILMTIIYVYINKII